MRLRWVAAHALFFSGLIGAEETKPDLDVPPNSELNAALRRVETRSGQALMHGITARESQASAWLAVEISPFDRNLLLSEFHYLRHELLAWNGLGRGHSFYLSPVLEGGLRAGEGDSSENAALAGLGMKMYGKLFPRLSYYTRGMVYTEFTDRPQFTHQFDPDFGETYSVEKKPGDTLLSDRSFNRFEHYLLLDLPGLTLKAGRDRVHSGPGYFSTLTASRETPPYYLAEARLDFAPWLQVTSYLLRMVDSDHAIQKYASLHRFEFKPHGSFTFGFQDIVIYQDRDPDFRYFLPLTPLAFSEDNAGGGDNDAMAFDFLWATPWKISLWSELFIDDLLGPTSFFDNFWENRWSALAGFQAVSPWKSLDMDIVVEWSHVEPWTYIGRTPQTGFKHFNVPSASKLGPDSRSWDAQIGYRPWKWLELKERLEWNDKGTGRPGTLGVVHDDSVDGTRKDFLGGRVQRQRISTLSASVLWGQFLRGAVYWRQEFDGGDEREMGARMLLMR